MLHQPRTFYLDKRCHTAIPPELYGIRGVAVFYFSHESAIAGAASLGLKDPKILVSRNAAKEPDPTAPPPVLVTAEDAFTALGMNLTDEEKDRKAQIQKDTKAKIKRWFLRQRPAGMGIHANPFFNYLVRLRQDESDGPPRRTTDFKFYMKHPDFCDAVQARFLENHSDEPKDKHIALRCEIAKGMWEAEPADVRNWLRAENDAAHEQDKEAYKESGEGEPSADPEIQEECRSNFSSMVQPLLAGLQAYTGLTLNIIGGRINEETKEFETISANAGLVDGKDWPRWDPEGYAAALKLYLKFVHAGYLESNNLVDDGPGPSAVPAPAGPVIDASAFVGMNLMQMEDPNGDGDINMPLASDTDTARTGLPVTNSVKVVADPPALGPLPEEDDIDRALISGVVLPPVTPVAPSGSAPPAPSSAPAPPHAPPAASSAPALPHAPPAAASSP
ncbi:hypothetical protein K438DRAFT_2001197 [Mycena galopus ATCC 62051]|nr:hypothetical protein K438DRAFT_2001197 [Mycena galopus ATCC 62051]